MRLKHCPCGLDDRSDDDPSSEQAGSELPEGVEMVMPGDNIKMAVTLINPVAMDEGLRFAIREGGRTVGAGVVSSIKA